jgi:hypothetical protein
MILKTEKIITAFAEYAGGPGWANRPIWVIVRDANLRLREECIQPQNQTAEMHALFRVSNAAHEAMKSAVETAVYVEQLRAELGLTETKKQDD